jgi:hypothetical protein
MKNEEKRIEDLLSTDSDIGLVACIAVVLCLHDALLKLTKCVIH